MTNKNPIPPDKQVNHLILLVGGNPLPNAVAGSLLVRDGGQITLLHTGEQGGTKAIAERLKNWFVAQGMSKERVVPRYTDRMSRSEIYKTIEAVVAKNEKNVGLNYTSGTSAMSVHTHAAVSQRVHNSVLSYLDATTLCMMFDDGTAHYVGQPDQLNLSIEDLFLLHGTPLRKIKATAHNSVPPNIEGEQKGDRFEKDVGREMLKLFHAGQINEMWMNVKAEIPSLDQGKWPEFDVVALRGYQLFFISCATTAERGKLKQKLFEAYIRGRQLGGDEACIALACQKDDSSLEFEAQHTLQVEGRVRVFRTSHLPKLSQHLSKWVKAQSREGKPCSKIDSF